MLASAAGLIMSNLPMIKKAIGGLLRNLGPKLANKASNWLE
jgi:hypothetical protein